MSIPPSVLDILRRNELLDLATCKDNVPSTSLMNFVLLEPEQTYDPKETTKPVIVMATPVNTQKYENILANPVVAILIHDWISGEATAAADSSSLSVLLQRLNQTELAQRSATLMGHARIAKGDETKFYQDVLLKRHPSAKCFIKDTAIVLVDTTSVRVADSKNHVENYE